MKLKKGVYETLISSRVASDIRETEADSSRQCETAPIDVAESAKLLAGYLSGVVRKRLEDSGLTVEQKAQIVNDILKSLSANGGERIVEEPQLLTAVMSSQRAAQLKATKQRVVRPLSGFRVSNLFTGGQSATPLGTEILRDVASADRIYIIVSFLRMSGIRMILDELRRFCAVDGHSLRVITTTYCGITEGKAIEQLAALPNTEIRISYNANIERLHAKSYIFIRNSGFSTAYIGSSNLSHSAQTDGLEWNIRVTNVENPHIIKSAIATFDQYWNSNNFEDFNVGGIEKFNKELAIQRGCADANSLNLDLFQRFQVLPHQKAILDKLAAVREDNGLYRNLVVAATGTGKTVISAFDYKRFRESRPGHSRLLFVAHREEILRQSCRTYRSVLGDNNFGELWVGGERHAHSLDHLFISVASLNSHIDLFRRQGTDYYDYIVIDEAHHAEASSYRVIVNEFTPTILLGLTATPERMDGQSLQPDFGGKISAEIRLPQALNEGLLTPFQYICISDDTDLTGKELWTGKRYVVNKLSERLCNNERVRLIVNKLHEYLPDETKCHALCFCTDQRHANFMAQQLCAFGLRAAAVTSKTNAEQRRQLNRDLANGLVNYLCVVDIFNEGVDIPEIDTVLFLRPTDSLTVFLQQLGRGLRLSAGKDLLTVLDFVAQVNRQFDFTSRLRELCVRRDKNLKDQVNNGFTILPFGCSIYMERVAKERILSNISSAIYNVNRLERELRNYDGVPTLSQFVAGIGQDVRLLYRRQNCWTTLKRRAGKCSYAETADTDRLVKGMGNLVHINSLAYLRFIRKFIGNGCTLPSGGEADSHFALMLYYALFQSNITNTKFNSIDQALATLNSYPLFKQEMLELVDYLADNLEFRTFAMDDATLPGGLELYGCYTREEIFTLFNRQTPTRRMSGSVAGVFSLDEENIELLFVTINKSDKDFSPSTQYDDYFISANRFHWQSQNTMAHDNAGRRYCENNGRRFMLFVREEKTDGFGNTCPYYCMGFINYLSSYGNRPMNIEWQLEKPAMPRFIKAV